MAIAFYVPREYGPPDQQQQQQQNAAAEPRIVDIHEQHFQQDNNNNNVVPQQQPNNSSNHNQIVSLFTGLVNELLTVFGSRNVNTDQQRAAPEQSFRARRQAAQNLPNIDIQQDNQNVAAAQLPDLIPSYNPLPDVVHCHAGMSFSYNSSSAINQDGASSSRSGYPVAPLSPASSQHHPPTTVDFEVSVKLQMSVSGPDESLLLAQEQENEAIPASPEELYRIEGSRLRAIADSFEMSRNSRRRRVSPSSQSTFELKIVISVAVPTVALVALGFAYLRR